MPESRLEPGDIVRLQTTITDITGAAADPGGLTFTMNAPDGTVTTYVYETAQEIVREALGIYYVDWPIALVGPHRYQFKATGTNASIAESSFIVHALRVAPVTT